MTYGLSRRVQNSAGDDPGNQQDQSSHRWRCRLPLVRVGRSLPHALLDLHRAQPPDDRRPDDKGQQQRGYGRTGSPEREVVDQPQGREVILERREEPVEHGRGTEDGRWEMNCSLR